MDIKRAKQEIKDSIEAYLAKDEFGDYRIPVQHFKTFGKINTGNSSFMGQRN